MFIFECFYDSPPRFRAFSPSFLFFLLVRSVYVDVIVNASVSCILFYFLVYTTDGLGAGYRRNTLLFFSERAL